MAKQAPTLDTPFRRGEKVLTTQPVGARPAGSKGKVKLVNGFGPWLRYWVRFDDGELIGQVDHNDLVRPQQLQDWHDRAEAQALAAESATSADAAPAAEAAPDGGGGGAASLIPEHILERSRQAKARLLGG